MTIGIAIAFYVVTFTHQFAVDCAAAPQHNIQAIQETK